GIWVALGYRWGSSWFSSNLAPYLWSMVRLNPEATAAFTMPWVIKLHIALGFGILAIIPFTRLIHLLVAPFHYIARPYQVVMWNWDRRSIRTESGTPRLTGERPPAGGRSLPAVPGSGGRSG